MDGGKDGWQKDPIELYRNSIAEKYTVDMYVYLYGLILSKLSLIDAQGKCVTYAPLSLTKTTKLINQHIAICYKANGLFISILYQLQMLRDVYMWQ